VQTERKSKKNNDFFVFPRCSLPKSSAGD
jgi:hypothetical protein